MHVAVALIYNVMHYHWLLLHCTAKLQCILFWISLPWF